MSTGHRLGAPLEGPAPELVESGFHLENADAPLLHAGLNQADLAHVLDLVGRSVMPRPAARRLLALLLEADRTQPDEFPYDPAFGEPYNSRERFFVSRLGTDAGWLHAGRPRREAVRIALRLHLRDQVVDLIEAGAALADVLAAVSARHSRTWMPDQTYLQHAQPSTFGHYLLSFAYPVLRDLRRLVEALGWINSSPGGAGCVNGSRLLDDRGPVATMLGFDGVIEHTRDAMWQTDGLVDVLAAVASLVGTQSKLAEDLEIWASSEFDYVTLADGYSRSSILMPQKRNPYSLSIVRGASGVLIGRLTGFLAVAKSPSARSDNLIFAYGEVPRALDLAIRVTRLMTGVVGTLQVNMERMAHALDDGYTQATDLSEFIVQTCNVDYRSAYDVVGWAVRKASNEGIPGRHITGAMLDEAAVAVTGERLGLAAKDLEPALDPRVIIETRRGTGGAAPTAVESMLTQCEKKADDLRSEVEQRRAALDRTKRQLLEQARRIAAQEDEA